MFMLWGELAENVLAGWAGFTAQYTTKNISYEEWNGDRLAELIMRFLLARELLDEQPRRNFQKAVAMVNEPSACCDYTRSFLSDLLEDDQVTQKIQLLRLRQAYICLHTVMAWSDEAGNMESAYKTSELGMMYCWHSIRKIEVKKKPNKHDKALWFILDQFFKLYLSVLICTSIKQLSRTVKHNTRYQSP